MTDLITTAPQMDLALHDIAHLVEELPAYHAISSPRFQRREQREAAHPSLQGLLAPLPRTSIEPMVLGVEGVAPQAVRALQSFISAGQWNDERLWHQHGKEGETDWGAADGVLMVDGSDLPKQGVHAVGGKRQSCGELGKRANCQAGVCIGSVSPHGSTILDRRLSGPTEWLTDDAYAARRRQGGLPLALPFNTKPALAQERLAAEVAAMRGIAVRDTLPGPDVWLVLRRHPETGEVKSSLCHAPVDTVRETLAQRSGMRWPIATCCEDSKHLLGLGDDAVRSWTGWPQHRTLVILAHFFVVRMSLRLQKKPQR